MSLSYVNGFSKGIAVAIAGAVPGPADTSITLETGAGALLPNDATLTTSPMRFVLRNGTTAEIVEATGRPADGDILTVTRAIETINGVSTAQAFAVAGTVIENSPTKATMEQFITDGSTLSTGLTFPNTGLRLLDTNASHDLIIAPGSNLSADHTLTITTGDADRTLTIAGTASVDGTNTGDQTFSNGSNATSHTLSLSGLGGSLQLVEGTNITLTTTGTAGDGIVTIAATGGGGIAGALTAQSGGVGHIPFAATSADTIEGEAALVWDKTNNRLGVGTAAPAQAVDVVGGIAATLYSAIGTTVNTTNLLTVQNTDNATKNALQINNQAGSRVLVVDSGSGNGFARVYNSSNVERVRLDSNTNSYFAGNLSVGVDSNSYPLYVKSTGNNNCKIEATGGYCQIDMLASSGGSTILYNDAFYFYKGGNIFVLTSAGDAEVTNHLKIKTAGKGLYIKEGTNAKMGQSVLVAGTVTVSTTAVTASSRIFLTRAVAGGTLGHLSVGTITAATSFVINSSDVADTSTINWMIVEPA